MPENHSLPPLSCTLAPIGVLRAPLAQLFPKFRPGLSQLHHFSHALVFWQAETPDGGPVTLRPGLERLGFAVCQLTHLDEQQGLLGLAGAGLPAAANLLDIKPYFPVEDRVRNVRFPAGFAAQDGWFDAPTVQPQLPPIVPEPQAGDETLTLQPTGLIRSQSGRTFVQLDEAQRAALASLEGFSHLRLVWWFSRLDEPRYRRVLQVEPPYPDAPRTGVFASRSPVRPNPLAVTVVRVLALDAANGWLEVSALDAYDRTPLLGLQPYLPACERVRTFQVPPWVRHWPEWWPEEETPPAGQPALFPDDGERLRTLFPAAQSEGQPTTTWVWPAENPAPAAPDAILVSGARQHNLKNITVAIPHNRLTVVTGVSGSGKSSLAFDTIYAEGQRRYMGSLSTLAREALEQLPKPDVDAITGLAPAVAIEQKMLGRNPRSTVGTITEIFDYLRLLYTRIGRRHCPVCGRRIQSYSPQQVCDLLQTLPADVAFDLFARLPGGELLPVARQVGAAHPELRTEVTTAMQRGDGSLTVRIAGQEDFQFSARPFCPHCQRVFFKLTPSAFSYNSPDGMCPECNGLGVRLSVDPDLIVPHPERSLLDEASPWWGNLRQFRQKPTGNWWKGEVIALANAWGVDLEPAWQDLPEEFRRAVLYGADVEVTLQYQGSNNRSGEIARPVGGAVNNIERLSLQNPGDEIHRFYLSFMRQVRCPACNGERLSAEGRLVSLAGQRYPAVAGLSIAGALRWIETLPERLEPGESDIARELLGELRTRLRALLDVGLHYLTLDRSAATLSGGEAQRIRLATRLQSGLTGLLYVLDEPSMGLHPRDHRPLLATLRKLCEQGNTVLMVEHDAASMQAADWLIDLGPGAGELGGELIAAGTPQEVQNNPHSLTGQYLSGALSVTPPRRALRRPTGWIELRGARLHNLQSVNVRFPLGVVCCISGVSGSGKSSLVSRTLYPAVCHALNGGEETPGPYEQISGLEQIDKVINITQGAIGRSSRSNPATYIEVFDEMRKVFAGLPEAKARRYKVNHFSFNSKDGACPECDGAGEKKIEMYFLPDVAVTCQRCGGKRYREEVLQIRYQGKNIADVLDMDARQALQLFAGQPRIVRILQTLCDVGLEYIRLGQSALTLSGGEAQRVRLARELSREDTGRTLFILDEPTSGLHFADIRKLLEVLQRLAAAGNSVLVIEHHLDVIRSADWVIDLGPDGGSAGGQIVAAGTPQDIIACPHSHTGRCLSARQ